MGFDSSVSPPKGGRKTPNIEKKATTATQTALRLFREVHHLEKAVERKEFELQATVLELSAPEYADYVTVTLELAKEWDK